MTQGSVRGGACFFAFACPAGILLRRSYVDQPRAEIRRRELASEPGVRQLPRLLGAPRRVLMGEQRVTRIKDFHGVRMSGTDLDGAAGMLVQSNMFLNDLAGLVICVVLSFLWLFLWQQAREQEILSSQVVRKVIHITTAPAFLLLWPLFSAHPSARVFAALLPFFTAVRVFVAGKQLIPNSKDTIATSVSRSGAPAEALRGPLYYIVVIVLTTLVFWRDSPVSAILVCQMCFGDGFAEVVGKRFGTTKWWWSKTKSVAGSAGFVVGAFSSSLVFLTYFGNLNLYDTETLWCLLFISIACSLVELLPIGDDNINVPVTAAALSAFLFGF
ncbi:putative phytol kinase 1, chloroplastic [Porphyridium purpureum]|uniref:phytol kinase n=1 Tax=Porphyridium purpureum TaxID=35688 RepID=A0A5J4Z314_PORPP|nr:putative phytol kinase 1, chloroplastic [Porphyridium purpureum]|eukprot:POR5212..scf295_1